ncbi:uncharacterized protein LOC111867688 isoform X2 [Cryptotermes secundus]|nr:uncharacterized protein LOC111867688 isoform X2 [Cryptotermes secundus]XP_023713513.1 uncharacterized protein LOC111867688 isoform X2 [Cryptotermes secundus]
MDFILSFWATLMMITGAALASNGKCQPENGTLTVSHSDFKNLLDYYCSGNLSNLHTFRLQNNNLSSLDAKVFIGASSLKHLVVIQNHLESLDRILLHSLKELISLDLSQNRLRSLNDKELFLYQSKLKFFRLSYNQITNLDLKVLYPLHSLKELNLAGNPISCGCEIRHIMKWCVEKNVSVSAACDNELTEFRPENCTHLHVEGSSSVLLTLVGIGIIVVISGGLIAEVSVYCLRKASRANKTDNEHATSKEISANQEVIFYRIRPNQTQEQNNSNYCKIILPRIKSDIYTSPQYEELTRRQSLHDTGRCSNLGEVNEVTTTTDSATTYAEPFQYAEKASEIYAVPYHEPNPYKDYRKTSYENILLSESNNGIPPLEVSVRNSLYSSP